MMRGSFTAEILKQRKRATTWVLLAVMLVLGLFFRFALPYASYATASDPDGPASRQILAATLPSDLVANAIAGFPVFAGALALIFGALAVGSEYGWGTWKTVLTQGPGRLSVYAGKFLALAVMVLAGVLAMFAACAVASAVIATLEGQPLDWPSLADVAAGVASGWLIMAMWCLAGAVVALALKGVALPVGLGVVWILAFENLISAVADGILTALQPLRDVLPSANAGSLVSELSAGLAAGETPAPGITDSVSASRALVTLAAYLVVLTVWGAMMLRRRDVT